MFSSDDTLIALLERFAPGAQLDALVRLTGGVSAEVFRLDFNAVSGSRQSVVLRVHGDRHAGHTAELEYQLLSALYENGLPVAEPLAIDASGKVMPQPYLIMTFVEGVTIIPPGETDKRIATMAALLVDIHAAKKSNLPELPLRLDPLPEVLDFLPEGDEWQALRDCLQRIPATAYTEEPKLLHGDYWPENILWQGDRIAAVLDWEDAAIGDPLSDVAAAGLELRYKFGVQAMHEFTRAYAAHQPLDSRRLALWRIYVAAAAQRYMGAWGLEPEYEAHMRSEALACIREAGEEISVSG